MDIGSAFTFVFDDKDWLKKVGIGGIVALLSIFILPTFIMLGYIIETLKHVRDQRQPLLPEWENWGDLFFSGLKAFAIYLIYASPIILLSCGFGVLTAVLGGAGEDAAGAIGVLVLCFYCLLFIFALGIGIVAPVGLIRYARYGTIGSALQFGEMFQFIRDNIGDYLIVDLLSVVALQIIAQVGVILCFVGVFFTSFYAYVVMGHLFGQLARKEQALGY